LGTPTTAGPKSVLSLTTVSQLNVRRAFFSAVVRPPPKYYDAAPGSSASPSSGSSDSSSSSIPPPVPSFPSATYPLPFSGLGLIMVSEHF